MLGMKSAGTAGAAEEDHMVGSLKDQLLKAGLTDEKKARQMEKEKRKQARVARSSGVELVNEAKAAARQALAEKAERDRALNQARNSKAERKAINAQIKQLIETNKLATGKGDIGFNFTDGKKVKKVYVSPMEQKQLSAGRLAIVKQGDKYEIVPWPVAEKIAERDSSRVIDCTDSSEPELNEEEKDWYKDYEIPDDLMW
ncbi:DUF2058 domain-containing protein [Seongchinamella unica]|nr:DUF2058 domain-containing protein [Seongchinamella unica]